MSFSYNVKAELCRAPVQRLCCARAEAYGVLLYCSTFTPAEVRIITGNPAYAERLPRLFSKAFRLHFDQLPEDVPGGKFIFRMTDAEKIAHIINTLGYDPTTHLVHHINFGILEDECCRASFVRGAFLAGGSVTDPAKRYHLELTTSHHQASREMAALLTDMGYLPKSVTRQGNSITYFKQSEHIEDILTHIGAPVAAMDIMSAKVEKNLRNSVNRRVNCDAANLDKAIEASQEQVEAIRRLMETGRIDSLGEKIRQTALARLESPELTLSELAASFDPPITKSCLNHRMRKIMELARE